MYLCMISYSKRLLKQNRFCTKDSSMCHYSGKLVSLLFLSYLCFHSLSSYFVTPPMEPPHLVSQSVRPSEVGYGFRPQAWTKLPKPGLCCSLLNTQH